MKGFAGDFIVVWALNMGGMLVGLDEIWDCLDIGVEIVLIYK